MHSQSAQGTGSVCPANQGRSLFPDSCDPSTEAQSRQAREQLSITKREQGLGEEKKAEVGKGERRENERVLCSSSGGAQQRHTLLSSGEIWEDITLLPYV